MEAIYVRGLSNLVTRRLKDDGTDFDGAPRKWSGAVEMNVTFSKPRTKFPADDNPAYAVVSGAPIGSGTMKLFGMKNSDYIDILPVEYVTGKGVRFGADLPDKFFGLSFVEKVSDGSENKMLMYKVAVTEDPAISNETINDEGVTIKDFIFNIEIYPVFFDAADGKKGRVIRDIINSVDDSSRWDENKDTIVFPYDLV
jgi:hypothetical protein